jgi:hypothetical protein
VYILPEDGHRSGSKHVVVVHNKIEHEKHLLHTVVLIEVRVKLTIHVQLMPRSRMVELYPPFSPRQHME